MHVMVGDNVVAAGALELNLVQAFKRFRARRVVALAVFGAIRLQPALEYHVGCGNGFHGEIEPRHYVRGSHIPRKKEV
jgi:hypothetical protein